MAAHSLITDSEWSKNWLLALYTAFLEQLH
jgi:hypothetical protein